MLDQRDSDRAGGHPPNIHLDVRGYVGGGRWRENENGIDSDRAGGHPPNIHHDVRGYVGWQVERERNRDHSQFGRLLELISHAVLLEPTTDNHHSTSHTEWRAPKS